MSRIQIKICGVRDQAGLDAAVEAGADMVGFVIAASPRQVSARQAALLLACLPSGVRSVVVTRVARAEDFAEMFALAVPNFVQADAAGLDSLQLPDGCLPLPVYHNQVPVLCPGYLMFEGQTSGAGRTADWAMARQLARRTNLMLAGGLNAGNVGEAIAMVRPYAVDVSSGVELTRGAKDPQRIREFVAAVRAAEREME